MSRNSLLQVSRSILDENKDFSSPPEANFKLSGKPLKDKMVKLLEKLYNDNTSD